MTPDSDSFERLALFVALAVAVLVLASVPLFLTWRRKERPAKSTRRASRLECPNCQRELLFTREEMVPLSAPEMALTVSAVPDVRGRKLAEYECPHCGASHCFAIDSPIPVYVITNNFNPQADSNHCANCRRPLLKPTWPVGAYDGRVEEAPGLTGRHGLRCSRCGAVSCVQCCRDVTRNRTNDGSYLCPRCNRGPIAQFHDW